MFQIARKISKNLEPVPLPVSSLMTSSAFSDRASRSRDSSLTRSQLSFGASRSEYESVIQSTLKAKKVSRNSEKLLEFVHTWDANISALDPQNNNTELWGPDFATQHGNVSLHWKSCITATQPSLDDTNRSSRTDTAIKCFVGYKFGPWGNIKAEFATKIQKPDGTWSNTTNKAALWVLQGVSRGVVDLLQQEVCDFQPGDLIFSNNPVKVVIILKISDIYFDPIRAIEENLLRKIDRPKFEDESAEECYFGPAFKYVIADLPDTEAESDFKIIAGKTGRKFHCHKFVLRQKIPEFSRNLFNGKQLEENCLILDQFSPEVINEALFFMYKDKVSEKFPKLVLEVLELAEVLKYASLKKICEPELVKILNVRNVEILTKKAHSNNMILLKSECEKLMVELIGKEVALKYLEIADEFCLDILRNIASNVIASNFKEIRKIKKNSRETKTELWNDLYDLMADRLQAYHIDI